MLTGNILKERLLLKMQSKEKKTASNIILVSDVEPEIGEVVLMGAAIDEEGLVIGAKVNVQPHAGVSLKIDNEDYQLVSINDIRYIYNQN